LKLLSARPMQILLLLVSLSAGFLMITVSRDMAEFAPVTVPAILLYAIIGVEGVLSVLASRDVGRLTLIFCGANLLSMAVFVGGITLAMSRLGLPVDFDLIVGWTIQPLLVYGVLGSLFGAFGALVGMAVRPW